MLIYEQTPKRQRPKKIQSASSNVTTKESMRALVDALDANILTPQVWIELVCHLYELEGANLAHIAASLTYGNCTIPRICHSYTLPHS
jgi:hypothetical protein